MRARGFSWAFCALVIACGAGNAAAPAKPPAPARAAAAIPAPRSARERLQTRLRAVPRPPPVLAALDAASEAALDRRLQSLSAEERTELVGGSLADSVPLLHLRAGGGASRALYALATTDVASVELPEAFQLPDGASEAERTRVLSLARELAERAALHFLRDRALDVAADSVALQVLQAIERAARAAAREDLVELALEAQAERAPAPAVWLALGREQARAHDRAGLSRSRGELSLAAPSERAQLEKLARALEESASPDALTQAWAELELARFDRARRVLAPLVPERTTDLRIAAASALVEAEGSGCPGLPPGVGSPRLCAWALSIRPGLSLALVDLERAWSSQKGRDERAVEAYLGLAHVVPWVTEMSTATDVTRLERDFTSRYSALAAALAQRPEQRPFAIFAAALALGVQSGLHARPGHRTELDPKAAQALLMSARSVSEAAPRLATAAVLASQQSISELVPETTASAFAAAQAGLLAWDAAASDGDAELVERARSALARSVAEAGPQTSERSALVLLLGELDAAHDPGDRSFRALAQIASQLIAAPLPPELALRAVLDAAGALDRLGRHVEALGVLRQAASLQAPAGPLAELAALIRAEQAVLEWDEKRDPGRAKLAAALAEAQVHSASPTILAALAAWSGSHAFAPGYACGQDRACRAAAVRARPAPRAVLAAALGEASARLLAKGTLRATRVSLRVAYTFEGGIVPEVNFEPMLVPLVGKGLIQRAL